MNLQKTFIANVVFVALFASTSLYADALLYPMNDSNGFIKVARKNRKDSSKNERHGDSGRSQAAARVQIENLRRQITPGMSRAERIKIENKISNIQRVANRKAKGEEHGRRGR